MSIFDKFSKGLSDLGKSVVDVGGDIISSVWQMSSDVVTQFSDVIGVKGYFDDLFKVDLPPDQGFQVQRDFDTNASLGIVYGDEVKLKPTVVAKEVSSDHQYLHVFYAFAVESAEITEIYIDGQSGADADYVYNPISNVYNPNTRFNGKVFFKVANTTSGLGTTPTTYGCTIYNPSIDLFGKMLVVYARYEYDREVYQGEPQIYALSRSTDTTLSNPALALKHYLSASEYGAGLSASQVDVVAASVLCDELVTIPATAGTRKRYTINTVIDTKQGIDKNVELFKKLMDADLNFINGVYVLSLRGQGDAVVTFDHDNIIGDVSFSTPDQTQLFNLMAVNFTDKNSGYKTNTAYFSSADITYPYAGFASDFKTLRDNGIEKEKRITLNGVTSFYEAQAYAEKVLKESLYSQTADLTTSWAASSAVIGDVVGLTVTELGFADKEFRVLDKEINLNGSIKWTLIEHNDSIYSIEYDNSEPSEGTYTYPNPWVRLPAPTNVTITEKDDFRTGVADISFDLITGANSALVDTYVVKITSQTTANKVYIFESLSSPIYVNVEPDTYDLEVYAISDLQIEGVHSAGKTWAVKEDYQYTPPPAVTSLSISESVVFRERYPVSVITLTWADDAAVTVPLQYEIFQNVAGSYVSKGVTNEKFFTLELASLDYVGQSVGFVVQSISYGQQKLAIASSTSGSVTINGDTVAPQSPIEFDIDVLSETSEATWQPSADDLDIDYFIIKYNASTDTSTITWENSIPFISNISHQSRVKKFGTRLGSYLIKAVDTSGNISTGFKIATTTVPKSDALNLVKTIDDSAATPAWPGSKDGFVVNVSGDLETTLNSAEYSFIDSADLGDIYTVRISSKLGISTNSKTADVAVFVSYTSTVINFNDATDVPDIHSVINVHAVGQDWTEWRKVSIGDFTGRVFRFKIRCVKSDSNVVNITSDKIEIDMPERRESVYNQSIASGGTAIPYANGFYTAPFVGVTISGMSQGDNYVISSATANGFTINIYDSTGTGKAGTIDYQAVGYGRVNSEVL